MKILLYGADSKDIIDQVEKCSELTLVDNEPDVVVCYGGDGTLLSAELKWPGIPKVPIRNSRRGHRCIPHAPDDVIARLAQEELVKTEYIKLECAMYHHDHPEAVCFLSAMNEVNVHMAHINSAVRYKIWINDEMYTPLDRNSDDHEIIGDGFVISTPFGSTAYFNHITRGVFRVGLGIAFKYTAEQANHLIVPDDSTVRVMITRGPAVLAFDNLPSYFNIQENDEIVVRKHSKPAILLTYQKMKYPSDRF